MTIADQLREEGRYQGRYEGRQEGRYEGRQEGVYNTTRAFAIKLLKRDMDLNEVADLTGMSIEQLETLQQEPVWN